MDKQKMFDLMLERIERDKDCKPRCCCNMIGVTGPTGPTHTVKSGNK